MSTSGKKGIDWTMFPGCLTLLLFLIGAFAVPPAYFLNDERMIARASGVSLIEKDASGGDTLFVVAVPGYSAIVSYEAGKSLKGLWGSDDLALTVSDPASGATLYTQDLSAPKDWIGSIMVVGDSQEKTASPGGELLLPAGFGTGEYEGRLAGTVELPKPSSGEYTVDEVTLDVPLRLTVLSAADAVAGERAQSRIMVIGGGVGTVLFLALTALVQRLQRRR
jgi:hypothetical protein